MPESFLRHARQRNAIIFHQALDHRLDQIETLGAITWLTRCQLDTVAAGRPRYPIHHARTHRQSGWPPADLTQHVEDIDNEIDLADLARFETAEFAVVKIHNAAGCRYAKPIFSECPRVMAGRTDPCTALERAANQKIVAALDVGQCGEERFPECLQNRMGTLMRVDRVRSMPAHLGVIEIA